MRKPTIWVSRQVQHKPACAVIGEGWKVEISDISRRGTVLSVSLDVKLQIVGCLVLIFFSFFFLAQT